MSLSLKQSKTCAKPRDQTLIADSQRTDCERLRSMRLKRFGFSIKTVRPDSGLIDGMTGISRPDKLRLFKQLLRYSNTLRYTDRDFYLSRVRHEFNKNKQLTDPKDVHFFYQVSDGQVMSQSRVTKLILFCNTFLYNDICFGFWFQNYI